MSANDNAIAEEYLRVIRTQFREQKLLAEKAIAQISEEDYHTTLDSESNSIALIMKHIAGNAISRWTDFLTTDGEKPGRNRDREFVDDFNSIEELRAFWERGWQAVFEATDSLQAEDLTRTVYIRNEAHSVIKAINRQISHYGYHVGQIVLFAKHLRNESWKTLSIPRRR